MISQKLDLLMKITNTQNSTLGRALSFDSSYIGRIRAGKRGLPKNQPFIKPAAAFFARNLREQYQKATVAGVVRPGLPWPDDKQEAEALLVSWLSNDDNAADSSIGRILTSLSALPPKREPTQGVSFQPKAATPNHSGFYYGNNGKRDAVEAFLSTLCALDTPQTLLLYSDEDMSWLYEDTAFAKRWATLLIGLISKGGRIRIIHTVSRGIGEMLEAVQKWLPLYASGAIEPYFYPKLRDNVYRRTLFIAKGHSALISNSVGSHTQEALNILTDDAAAVHALESEFADYFSLCKPLMQIFNIRNSDLLWKRLKEFEESGGNLVTAHPVPSHFTMPEAVASSMAAKSGNKWVLHNRNEAAARFERNLKQGYTVSEILELPSLETVRSGEIGVPMCDLFGQPNLKYTADEFRAHLERVSGLLRMHEGYNVIISEQAIGESILFAKEDIGAIMLRSAPPTMVFGISEQSMTAAFWEYLQRLMRRKISKEAALEQLDEYIRSI